MAADNNILGHWPNQTSNDFPTFLHVSLYNLSHYALGHTEEYFKNRIWDFYYLIFFTCMSNYIVGYFLDTAMVLLMPFCMTLLYVNSKKEPDAQVSIWGFLFRSANLPWVHLILQTLMGSDIVGLLQGIAIGHLYIFLVDTLPETHNIKCMETPGWFLKFYRWASVKIGDLTGEN